MSHKHEQGCKIKRKNKVKIVIEKALTFLLLVILFFLLIMTLLYALNIIKIPTKFWNFTE